MAWFRRKGPPRDHGRETEETAGSPPVVRLHSLALGNLLDELVLGGSYRFLDLGPAIGSNVEFLSRFALSVQVADLGASLASPEPRAWDRALESLEPEPDRPGYHAVLAWDLLNYLTLEQIRQLSRRLAAATRPGGKVFSLVYYSREMPAEPLRFRIADRETLTYERPTQTRPAPRYPQGVVKQAFPDFEIDRGYLLKTGLQEFLLARSHPEPPRDAEGDEEEAPGEESAGRDGASGAPDEAGETPLRED